jgi:YegS/Rv2252/BmrU family lipid kinase
MRLLVVVNPDAARADISLPALAAWFEQTCEATVVTTRSRDHFTQILLRHGPEHDRIVIGGGDGTITEAVPHLLALGKPLAVLPLGTANDFARSLGLPLDVFAAARIAVAGRIHKVDAGLVNGRLFLNVASVGVAAQVSEVQSKGLKRNWRLLSYAISLVRVAVRSRPFRVELTIDGQWSWTGLVYQVSVANGRYHGGGLTVADHAAIDDGVLNVYFVQPGTFWQLIAAITHLKFRLTKPEILQRRTARHVTIRTRKPHPINADGELSAMTPAEFTLLPRALSVIVPQCTGEETVNVAHKGHPGTA